MAAPGVATRKKFYFDQLQLVAETRKTSQQRQWAKHLRERVLGGKYVKFSAVRDVEKLRRMLVGLKVANGLDVSSFAFDDTLKKVNEKVNEIVYDTLADFPARTSQAEMFVFLWRPTTPPSEMSGVPCSTWSRGA
ncbi:hypothetical protein CYMTET_56344 [Cymbomonas tetramitiformis]|uniref:Uncharacterized protein n=1 Tax=Cymbomonas tetramitiformis TaxID=36881 RepID=A0AAE0BB49_9CHLO|nr:hypothetical protein CYMTET_56344 [Cymbomonas tetramitiformis]